MKKTIADPASLEALVHRLESLTPDSPRQWGTLTPAEMLCHLGDATDSVRRPSTTIPRSNPIMKWIALSSPLEWPRGRLPTSPEVDPHAEGTQPSDFESDRRRAIDGLRAVAAAAPAQMAEAHGAFGPMTLKDWHRWAWRHTDHHLRQFGV